MPFRSEKQRRFLWAAHPDIAKRWAHEYPTKKKLPMYASDDKKPEKAETNSKQSAVTSVALDIYRKFSKKADVKEVYMAQPHSDKPTMAGENPPQVTKTKSERCNSETKPNYGVNKLMAKLSTVLSQPIMQAIENERAELEAREAAMQPANVGIKRYAMPAMGTPLPMGMQAQAPQAQPQAPAAQPANMGSPAPSGQLPPVGGGSSPNANPINSYGGISSSGDINGNAAFGTANSVGGEKLAANWKGLTAAGLMTLGTLGAVPATRQIGHELLTNPQARRALGDVLTTGAKDIVKESPPLKVTWPFLAPLLAGTAAYAGQGLKRAPTRRFTKLSADSPAWQRSAGKNPEGGLNEKGRKSYERETGGNLKAPVTESKPTGERAKRQNSFCSRMCGMKRVNTGAKTKSDPDSRINKSLRKWNCKCSSAMEFGAKLASALIAK